MREHRPPGAGRTPLHWVARAGVWACVTTWLCGLLPILAQSAPAGTAIANTAKSVYALDASDSTSGIETPSNTVTTIVASLVTFDPLTLTVDPPGAVAPGATLAYTLTAINASGIALPGASFALPLDPELLDPASLAGEIVVGGAPTPLAVAYDPATRTARWTVPVDVPLGETVVMTLAARVRLTALTGDTVVETATGTTAVSVAPLSSNTVTTAIVAPDLRVTKTADRAAAVPGDGVGFELTVAHEGTAGPMSGVVVVDALPEVMRYVAGTTRLDGVGAPDPAIGADGRSLRFGVPDLAPGDTRVIRFGARVVPTALEGNVVNRAHAEAISGGDVPVVSAEASAAVRVIPGPFRQEASVVGRVFVDDDGDGRPGAGEPGVPGVLVVFEDGRGAVTDVAGRWHLEGVRPGLHVARLDPGTLDPPLVPRPGGAEWAGGSHSRFVDVRAAELYVADFPVGPSRVPRCTLASGLGLLVVPAASAGTEERARALADAAAAYFVDQGETRPARLIADCEGEEALGASLQREMRARAAARTHVAAVPIEAAAPDPAAKDPLEEIVRQAPPAAAIVYPADGTRAPRAAIDVEIVYPVNSRVDLTVNGDPVPMDFIGATSTLPSRGVAASRFIGVKLRPGINVLELRATPPGAATPSAPVRVSVYRPGSTVALGLAGSETRCLADAMTPCIVRVAALDEAGMRAGDEPSVTLTVEGARVLDEDADPRTDGIQVRLVEGAALVNLAPPASPGRIRVFAQAGWATAETLLEVDPPAGPWRITGLAEGHLAGAGGLEGDGGLPPGLQENVQDDGARLAVLAQGPVLRASHLTVAIDTERERDRYRLFDRFRPDQFFPVYGDSSAGLIDAARQGPFYARLDGPKGFVAAGDFETAFTRTELSRYDRRLTGAWGRAGNALVTLEAFAASTDQSQVRDVFAPDGTSGPYLLSRRPVVAYSESVVLEIRDRWHPEDVVHRVVKQPELDYAIDPDAGTILFRGPVAPFDPDLNPVRVVVLYEARSGVGEEIAAGARLVGHPTPRVDLGATAVHEGRLGEDLELYGVDVVWRPQPGTTVAAEAAATSEGDATEVAYRLEATSQATPHVRWEAHLHDVPAGFVNPSFLSAPEIGGTRASGNVAWQSAGPWRVKGDTLWQRDDINDLERATAAVLAERRTERWGVIGGLRGVTFDTPAGEGSSALLEVGVRGKIRPRWTAELFRAQVVAGEFAPGYPNRTAAGITWDMKEGRRLLFRHEIESGGDFPTHRRSLVGVESRIGANTRALVNYALEGGASGVALRASSGIETVLPVTPSISVLGSAAVVDTHRGDDAADFVALAGGCEYRSGTSLVAARYEVNFNHLDVRHLVSASGVFRVGDPWTVFVREQVFLSDPSAGPTAARADGLLGAAYRPATGPFQFLARLDHIAASGTPLTAGGVTPGGVASEPSGSVSTPVRDPGQPGLGLDYARYSPAANRDSAAINLAAGFRIDPRNRLATTLVVRNVGDEAATGIPGSVTWLTSLHYTTHLATRWTLGASLRRFAQSTSDTASYGQGIELGYLAFKNLWIAAGYNVTGFVDREFPSAERTDRGPFVTFRFKFDEQSLASIKDLRLDR
jgi:uncharacterized repeat protein (TIGR01451 family)